MSFTGLFASGRRTWLVAVFTFLALSAAAYGWYLPNRINDHPEWIKDKSNLRMLANYGPVSDGTVSNFSIECGPGHARFWCFESDLDSSSIRTQLNKQLYSDDNDLLSLRPRPEALRRHNKVAQQLGWNFPGRTQALTQASYTNSDDISERAWHWYVFVYPYQGKTRIEISEVKDMTCIGD